MCDTDRVREDGKIRVFLLDDHEVVRRGVHDLLSGEADIEVVGEAGTAAEAQARVTATRPDVAVLDVRLPDGSGVEVCRDIRSRDESVRCLMLTSFADDEALFDAIMAGASGYVLKDIRGAELLGAVREVGPGGGAAAPEDPAGRGARSLAAAAVGAGAAPVRGGPHARRQVLDRGRAGLGGVLRPGGDRSDR